MFTMDLSPKAPQCTTSLILLSSARSHCARNLYAAEFVTVSDARSAIGAGLVVSLPGDAPMCN